MSENREAPAPPVDSPIPEEKRRKLAAAFQRLGFELSDEANQQQYAGLIASGDIGPLYWDQADTFAAWFRDRLDVVDHLIERSRR
jgi:hypothetical protein